MLRNKFATLHLKFFLRSSFVYARQFGSFPPSTEELAGSSTGSSDSLVEEIKAMLQQQQQSSSDSCRSSIYRVPAILRKVDPKVYEPQYVSIGPYHHGSPSLQDAEKLKRQSLSHIFSLGKHRLLDDIRAIELEARDYYADDVKLSGDKFVKMMLLDGCFIVHLFLDLKKYEFESSSLLSKRWMLPIVRRDLLMLENQIPMIVLKKIFDATRTTSEKTSIEELTLRFFDPLMPREKGVLQQSIASVTDPTDGNHQNFQHLLDVFHSSVSLGNKVQRKKELHMHHSVAELRLEGIKVRVARNSQLLDLKFNKGVLKIPSLQINNQTASFFRNVVAYEQCHPGCNPDLTTYLFFLNKLINSAEDVGLLHHEKVIQHVLGSDEQVAQLINNLCIEVEHDGQNSYLYELVKQLNVYSNKSLVKAKARLKHDYFRNVWVSLSTFAAFLLIYLALVQASYNAIQAQEKKRLKGKKGVWVTINSILVDPIEWFQDMVGSYSTGEMLSEKIDP